MWNTIDSCKPLGGKIQDVCQASAHRYNPWAKNIRWWTGLPSYFTIWSPFPFYQPWSDLLVMFGWKHGISHSLQEKTRKDKNVLSSPSIGTGISNLFCKLIKKGIVCMWGVSIPYQATSMLPEQLLSANTSWESPCCSCWLKFHFFPWTFSVGE